MKNIIFILAMVVFCSAKAEQSIQYFPSINEIISNYFKEFENDGFKFDEKDQYGIIYKKNQLRVKEIDLNGDGNNDYWLNHDILTCGINGQCIGSSYIWTSKGYCESDAEITNEDITDKSFPKKIMCKY